MLGICEGEFFIVEITVFDKFFYRFIRGSLINGSEKLGFKLLNGMIAP